MEQILMEKVTMSSELPLTLNSLRHEQQDYGYKKIKIADQKPQSRHLVQKSPTLELQFSLQTISSSFLQFAEPLQNHRRQIIVKQKIDPSELTEPKVFEQSRYFQKIKKPLAFNKQSDPRQSLKQQHSGDRQSLKQECQSILKDLGDPMTQSVLLGELSSDDYHKQNFEDLNLRILVREQERPELRAQSQETVTSTNITPTPVSTLKSCVLDQSKYKMIRDTVRRKIVGASTNANLNEIDKQRRYHLYHLSNQVSILGGAKNQTQESPSYLELKQRAENIKIPAFNTRQLEKLLYKPKPEKVRPKTLETMLSPGSIKVEKPLEKIVASVQATKGKEYFQQKELFFQQTQKSSPLADSSKRFRTMCLNYTPQQSVWEPRIMVQKTIENFDFKCQQPMFRQTAMPLKNVALMRQTKRDIARILSYCNSDEQKTHKT